MIKSANITLVYKGKSHYAGCIENFEGTVSILTEQDGKQYLKLMDGTMIGVKDLRAIVNLISDKEET